MTDLPRHFPWLGRRKRPVAERRRLSADIDSLRLAIGRLEIPRLSADIDSLRLAIGRLESRTVRASRYHRIAEAEFRVFSQFGEDGIIQYLLGRVPIESDRFVEFGVQDYRESNTRFLLEKDNWRGLILDPGAAHLQFLRERELGWRHTIDARSAFVTRENVNELIAGAGFSGDIGLLSIDIDGNDYWVLDALDVVRPRIMVVEYNSTFGASAVVTIPYDPGFDRAAAHPTNLYWGASIAAIAAAADRKGLALVGSNSAGNNAFFVRHELLGDLPALRPDKAWVDARFRESRDTEGALTFIGDRAARVAAIASMPLVDLASGDMTTVAAVA